MDRNINILTAWSFRKTVSVVSSLGPITSLAMGFDYVAVPRHESSPMSQASA